MQKTPAHNRHFFWPLLVIALGAVALVQALGVFPPTVADLVNRAWPIVLVIVGLTLLLSQAGPLGRFAPLIAVIVSAIVLGVTVVVAYTTRAATERTDNVVQITQPLEEPVSLLRVIVRSLDTTVEISPRVPDEQRLITAGFIGSVESVVTSDFVTDAEGVATFSLEETRPSAIPALETIGRGRLRIELPVGVPIALDFTNGSGTVSLNLLGLEITRLDVIMQDGDLLLSLPRGSFDRPGEVYLARGDVSVFVPGDIGLAVMANGKTPRFAEGEYLFDPSSGAYLSRRFDDYDRQITLNLTVGGAIDLQ